MKTNRIPRCDFLGNPRLGAIKPAAFAGIVAVKGKPADDFGAIEKVRLVLKNGKVYLETKLNKLSKTKAREEVKN